MWGLWIGLGWLRIETCGGHLCMNGLMNLWVPSNAGNFLTRCKPVSFSWTLLRGVSNGVRKHPFMLQYVYNIMQHAFIYRVVRLVTHPHSTLRRGPSFV
jgi:hypothetical protein